MSDDARFDATVLLLVPNIHASGGVANYYRTLDLPHHTENVRYFFVNEPIRQSIPGRMIRLISSYWKFWRILQGSHYRVVVLNPSLNRNSFYREAGYCWLAQRLGLRIIVFFRGWSNQFEHQLRSPSIGRFIFAQTFRKVCHFIVLGTRFREKLLQLGCSPEARFWVESTVADDTFLSDFSVSRRVRPLKSVKLLFLSRLVASKGAIIAIDAFRIAQQLSPDTPMELTVAGEGPQLESILTHINTERIDGVRVVGAVEGESKRDVLFQSDILLFPTCYGEGMPNVVLEAMLYGLPVITRDVGAITDVVLHGVNGFVTDRSDPAIFAQWIVLLATNHDLRHRISIANHGRASALYTARAVRARFKAILDEALADL